MKKNLLFILMVVIITMSEKSLLARPLQRLAQKITTKAIQISYEQGLIMHLPRISIQALRRLGTPILPKFEHPTQLRADPKALAALEKTLTEYLDNPDIFIIMPFSPVRKNGGDQLHLQLNQKTREMTIINNSALTRLRGLMAQECKLKEIKR